MYPLKEIVQDIKRVFKLRKKILLFSFILFVGLSFGALQIIEPKYESSISILVQKEETLNPLVLYEMAVSIASEDRLKSFNEIIYSRSTMEKLIGDLNLDRNIETEAQKQALVNKLRNNIVTSSRSSDSFEITFYDTDPVRARDGVELLGDHFIETRLKLENKRNDEAVDFFQSKLDELEEIVDQQRNQLASETTEQPKASPPVNQAALQNRLQTIDSEIEELDWRIIQEENKLEVFEDFLNQETNDFSVQPLYKLALSDLPFGTELGSLLGEYDELKQIYTENYPRLKTVRSQIVEVAKRIPPSINSGLSDLKLQRKNLVNQRASVIDDMEQSFVASQVNTNKQSNSGVYQQLYNEMKVKLEQARATRDVGDKTDQFVILDPPYISKEPSFPDRNMVISVGCALGLVMGTIFMAMAEVLDTTIRDEDDLDVNKPIIAYLTDGRG